jgi:Cu/Ag efflux protein CusF
MNRTTKQITTLTGTLLGILFAGTIAIADDMGNMNGMPDMSSGMGHTSSVPTVGHGKGVVKAIDRNAGTVTIKHGPIKEFGWSGMTMTFTLRHRSSLNSLKKGEHVRFDAVQGGQGSTVITNIHPVP